MSLSIDFAICTHNEGTYIRSLLSSLCRFIEQRSSSDPDDLGIVIQDDYSEDPETVDILREFCNKYPFIKLTFKKFNGNFADHKNALMNECTRDWVLNLDADEMVSDEFLALFRPLILQNPLVDAYWIPRINTVDGLTLDHVRQWGWVLTSFEGVRATKVLASDSKEYELLKQYDFIMSEDNGIVVYKIPIVCWPDMQLRLYKNNGKIQWKNKVHEVPVGFEKYAHFPLYEELAIIHNKDIIRQERQNSFYDTL